MKKMILIVLTVMVAGAATLIAQSPSGEAEKASKVMITTDASFAKDTKKGVVLVDFWATWCRPCRMQAPIVDELSNEMKKIKFAKLDVDQNKVTASKFQVSSIPTLIIFKNGVEIKRLVGLQDKESLKAELNAALGK